MPTTLKGAVTSYNLGDKSAFDDIFALTYRKLFVSAKVYMKDDHEAEDAVQEAYIQAVNKLNTISDAGSALPWFQSVVRNVCLNKLRKKKDLLLDEGSEHILESAEETDRELLPEESVMNREKSSIIMELVAQLPFEQKEVVLMHYIQNRSVAEIAIITGAPVDTVKSRLKYAKGKLKKMAVEKERKMGVKLYSKGLWLFLPLMLRFFANSIPLSKEIAVSVLEAVGVSTGVASGTACGFAVAVKTGVVATLYAVGVKSVVISVTCIVLIGVIIYTLIGGIEYEEPPPPFAYVLDEVARLSSQELYMEIDLHYAARIMSEFVYEENPVVLYDSYYGRVGVYFVPDAMYEIMFYYGDFDEGLRSGDGVWLGVTRLESFNLNADGDREILSNYTVGNWENDMPNGYMSVNLFMPEYGVERRVDGFVVDGLWDGEVRQVVDEFDYGFINFDKYFPAYTFCIAHYSEYLYMEDGRDLLLPFLPSHYVPFSNFLFINGMIVVRALQITNEFTKSVVSVNCIVTWLDEWLDVEYGVIGFAQDSSQYVNISAFGFLRDGGIHSIYGLNDKDFEEFRKQSFTPETVARNAIIPER